jgi:hypothetical protein
MFPENRSAGSATCSAATTSCKLQFVSLARSSCVPHVTHHWACRSCDCLQAPLSTHTAIPSHDAHARHIYLWCVTHLTCSIMPTANSSPSLVSGVRPPISAACYSPDVWIRARCLCPACTYGNCISKKNKAIYRKLQQKYKFIVGLIIFLCARLFDRKGTWVLTRYIIFRLLNWIRDFAFQIWRFYFWKAATNFCYCFIYEDSNLI